MSDKEERIRALLYAYQMLCGEENRQLRGLGLSDNKSEEGKLNGIKTSRSILEDAIIDQALENND